jgi:superoxide dismutase
MLRLISIEIDNGHSTQGRQEYSKQSTQQFSLWQDKLRHSSNMLNVHHTERMKYFDKAISSTWQEETSFEPNKLENTQKSLQIRPLSPCQHKIRPFISLCTK